MSVELSARDRRVLIFGAAVVLLLVGSGRGLPALVAWTAERRARAAVAMAELARAERGIRGAAGSRRVLAQVRARLAPYDSALLAGTTPSVAGAALAELLASAASDADAELGAVHLSADTAAHSLLWRAVARTTAHGDLEAIALFLKAIEEEPRVLAMRDLSLSRAQGPVARQQRERLQLDVVIEGVFRAPPRETRP